LTLTLRDSNGRKVAEWVEHAKKGSTRFVLVLPPKARHVGQDKLILAATGASRSNTLRLSLTA
jgi:hypothetical protein